MELFKILGTIAIDNQNAMDAIDETTKKSSTFSEKLKSGIKTVGKWGAAVGTAATASAAALFKVVQSAASATDTIDKMSQKIGISREAYQELDFICSQSGTSVDTLQQGMKTLTNQMQSAADGTSSAVEIFDKLGISIYDANGELKNQEEMMWEAMSALQSMENQTEKAAIANDLFGRSGSELMPLLNGATGSIEAMRNQAHELGLVMSDETVDAGVKLTDTIDQTKRALSAIGVEIGGALMPIFQKVFEWVLEKMPRIKEIVGTVFRAIGSAITAVKNAFAEYMPIIRELVSVCFTHIKDLWDNVLKPIFKGIIEFLAGVFTGDWKRVWGGIKSVLTGILNGIIIAIENMINGAIKAINGLINGINSLIGKAGKVLGLSISIPNIPAVKLPRLEKGGVLEAGQVGLLEGNGAEAVVPLERNKAWIRAVAEDMRDVGIGGSDVLIQYMEQLIEMLSEFFPQLLEAAGHDIVANDGAILARYAPLMNAELGRISNRKDRGR